MKRLIIIFLCVLPTVMVSCVDRAAGSRFTIQLVRDILSDTTSGAYSLVRNTPDASGSIAVIGEPEDVMLLTEKFLTCDMFDNINGHAAEDFLPDFAGETISAIIDAVNSPYSGYEDCNNEGFLRELNVKNYLSALDTLCYSSPFAKERTLHKQPAKVIVLASSYSSAFGQFDIDTLRSSAGGKVPVISGLHAMFDYAGSIHDGLSNVLIWSTNDKLTSGIYASAMKYSRNGVSYSAFCPQSGNVRESFFKLLDMYRATGDTTMVTSVLIDDHTVMEDEIKAVADEVMTSEDDSMMPYREMLSSDFKCVTKGEAVVFQCYRYLRSVNGFTHDVAYPDMRAYVTVPCPDLNPDVYDMSGSLTPKYKFNRAPGDERPTFCLMDMKDRYVSGQVTEFMKTITPQMYSLYVR